MRSNYNTAIRDFATMADAMNRIFERSVAPYDYAGNGGSNREESGRLMRLPVDAWANDDGYTITAYLPGINPDDVEITFESDELTIRGGFPAVDEERQYLKRELYHGPFERRLAFNVPVNADNIEATFEAGVLTLFVPKAEEVRPKQIKIQAR